MLFKLASVLALASYAAAECPNACSGHGQCSNFDMCTCNRNFEGNDCSLRTCPFDRAHVDTAKGDLNGDQAISATVQVSGSQVYPTGTPEKYPLMYDGAAVPAILVDTAHEYMECSNKGLCDRNTGACECFEGYEGGACNRASCPNKCSGHGTCESIAELAFDNFENIYALWDKDATMGCACDAGFSGPDCSNRMCKYGIDPLYTDDTTARVQETHIRVETKHASTLYGTYALKFYDVFGEDYVTTPIIAEITDVNQCAYVTAALQALPNDVIETVECTASGQGADLPQVPVNSGFDLKLRFITNPGVLKQMEILDYLDGSQPTLTTQNLPTTNIDPIVLTTSVYQRGITGAFIDYFANKCEGVTAKVVPDSATATTFSTTAVPGSIAYLDFGHVDHGNLLKACLGDSDGDITNNVEVHNWDMGNLIEIFKNNDDLGGLGNLDDLRYTIGSFPHAIMSVPISQSPNDVVSSDYYGVSTDSGHFHLLWYEPTWSATDITNTGIGVNAFTTTVAKPFRIANLGTEFTTPVDSYIHTTDGVVQQLAIDAVGLIRPNMVRPGVDPSVADGELTDTKNETRIVGLFNQYSNTILTSIDASCETGSAKLHACLKKGDKLFVLDGCWGDGTSLTNPLAWNSATAPDARAFFGGHAIANCDTIAAAASGSGNLYTIEKIYTRPFSANTTAYDQYGYKNGQLGHEDRFVIVVDQNIGWDGSNLGDPDHSGMTDLKATLDTNNPTLDFIGVGRTSGIVILFKFTPVTTGTYTYVSQCSNRGACNNEEGLCQCFKGYHGDACQKQSSLAQ